MLGVAGLCAVVALLLAAPLLVPAAFFLKAGIHGAFWFVAKVGAYIFVFMWLRFTLPRYRFDQLMRLGWYFLIPVSIVNVMGIGVGLVLHWQYGVNRWVALGGTTLLTLLIALWLVWADYKREAEELQARSTPGARATDSYAG